MNRAQRVDEKNGVICLAMFTPRVMGIKMPQRTFFAFSADYSIFLLTQYFYISTLKMLFNSKAY